MEVDVVWEIMTNKKIYNTTTIKAKNKKEIHQFSAYVRQGKHAAYLPSAHQVYLVIRPIKMQHTATMAL